MDDLIIDKLKETKQLKSDIKLDDLGYRTKRRKIMVSANTHYLLLFLRDIHAENLVLEDHDNEQNKLVNQLGMNKGINKGKISVGKSSFQATQDYFLVEEKIFLKALNAKYFL